MSIIGVSVCAERCRQMLYTQHPTLQEIDRTKLNTNNHHEWLQKRIAIWGEYLEVSNGSH